MGREGGGSSNLGEEGGGGGWKEESQSRPVWAWQNNRNDPPEHARSLSEPHSDTNHKGPPCNSRPAPRHKTFFGGGPSRGPTCRRR